MKLPVLDAQMLRQKAVGDPYLKVKLTFHQYAVLPMSQAQEAIAIPTSRVTLIPNMHACVLGLLNHKNRVIWVVNLPQLLGLQTQNLNMQQQYKIAIIKSGKTPLGLVVPEIQGVLRFATETMAPATEPSIPSAMPYLQGYFWQDAERLWVLNPNSIIHSSILVGND